MAHTAQACICPHTHSTVFDGVCHTLLGRFSMVDISTTAVGIVLIVLVQKRSALERYSSRELSEGVSFGIGTLLVVRAITGVDV